ncbi:hypothetical protein BH20CHL1_BH20CHL1_05080 [soil metagenome]
MRPEPNQSRTCRVCGAALQPENRYCPNCGTPTTEATSVVEPTSADPVGVGDSGEPVNSDSHVIRSHPEQPDASITETRQFHIEDTPAALLSYQDPAPPLYEPTVTSVPPESGNRTLWIILGIVAAIVLVCCCLLPLGLMAVANVDTAFQEEIRSFASRAFL